MSGIAAIAINGLLALNLTTETVNSDIFYDFIRGSLIPQMRQFDGSNPRSRLWTTVLYIMCQRSRIYSEMLAFQSSFFPPIVLTTTLLKKVLILSKDT